MPRTAVSAVQAEVAQTQKLEIGGGHGVGQTGLHLTAGDHLQGVGVQALQEILAAASGAGSENRLS